MRLTREGKRFFLATFLIGIASFNTGNNLIYLIFASMLSILFIAAVVLWLNMRGLRLTVTVRGPSFAGEDTEVEASVENTKRFLPSYSLRILSPKGLEGGGVVPYVGGDAKAGASMVMRFPKRGVYKYGEFIVQSTFPFIFLSMKRRVPVTGEVTVYPVVREVEVPKDLTGPGYDAFTTRPGRSEMLLSVREFRHGDDVSHISWKATAKKESLMVREYAEERPRTVTLVLDDGRPFNVSRFEMAVSLAASMVIELIERGYFVRLVTAAKVLPFGTGAEHMYRMLDVLAVAGETEPLPRPPQDGGPGSTVLVLKSTESELKTASNGLETVVYATDV